MKNQKKLSIVEEMMNVSKSQPEENLPKSGDMEKQRLHNQIGKMYIEQVRLQESLEDYKRFYLYHKHRANGFERILEKLRENDILKGDDKK